jgi:OMF family outer membrane factor
MKRFIFIVLILTRLNLFVQAQELTSPESRELSFNNIDSLLTFAGKNSAVLKTNQQQVILAKYAKIAAITNILNLHNQVAFSLTDNNQLPINYIPAEIFGGPAGAYTELTLGQQYASNFNVTTQIDIINPAAWAKVKSATIGQELTNNNNLINKKSLFESIAACFYNITSLQEQIELTKQNLLSTDTLLMIIKNKYSLGLVRQQDVNDAMVNKLNLEDKLKQLQITLEQQYNSLKILIDIPQSENLTITNILSYDQQYNADLNVNTDLRYKSSQLETESVKADLKYNRLSHLPVVSLFYSYSYYQYSNNHFFDENVNTSKWLNASYVGVKLTFCFPDLNGMALTNKSKINYSISRINLEHSKYQNDISNHQLQLDYEKVYSQFITSQQISLLKDQNYKMAFDQYSQSILSFDKLLIAFNEMLVSRLNYSSALAGLLYSKTIIDLNNNIIFNL